jgi:hemerythrin-like domain-containing protein
MAVDRLHGLFLIMQPALETMRRRQRAMSSTLLAVRTITRRSLRTTSKPDFSQLNRLVRYLERFPQKLHQPAEEQYLFRALEQREPTASRAVARAKRDHAACQGYLNRLRDSLDRWTRGQESAGSEVALFSDDYARFCRLHARIEMRDVLTVAARVLTPADWTAIEQAYARDSDPLERATSRGDCEAALRTLA